MAIVYADNARGLQFTRKAIAQAVTRDLHNAAGYAAAQWGPSFACERVFESSRRRRHHHLHRLGRTARHRSLSDEFIAFLRGTGRSVVETLAPAMVSVEIGVRVAVENDESIVVRLDWAGRRKTAQLSVPSTRSL